MLQPLVQNDGVPVKVKKGAATSDTPENRAMATRFFHNVLILRYWQAQLLDALIKVK